MKLARTLGLLLIIDTIAILAIGYLVFVAMPSALGIALACCGLVALVVATKKAMEYMRRGQ